MSETLPRPPRLADWQTRLTGYLARCAGAPFEWGRQDCALFLAGAVEAMTGADFARPYRGNYQSAGEGRALLRQNGFASHVDLARRTLPGKHRSRAAPGDGAILRARGGIMLGVFQGPQVYVLRADRGLALLSPDCVIRVLEV